MNKIFHVFVSSTYVDLIEERKAVSDMIAKAGFVAEGMEIFPASSQSQMEFIEQIIDRCDYYVLILAGRYGSVDGSGTSYTELEYQYAVEKGIPVLAFLHNDLGSLPNNNVDGDRGKIDAFRDLVSENAIVDYWAEPNELAGKAIAALSHSKNFHPGVGWVRGDSVASEDLLQDINDLRKENRGLNNTVAELTQGNPIDLILSDAAEELLVSAVGGDGQIHRYTGLRRLSIQTIEREFLSGDDDTVDARSKAKWEAALEELEFHMFISDASQSMIEVLHNGFLKADRIISSRGCDVRQ